MGSLGPARKRRLLGGLALSADAGGVPNADRIATWDGTSWRAVSSATEQIEIGRVEGLALALIDRQLYAAGNFKSAGGDGQAHSVASFGGHSV